jgi:hypothetical protein
MVAAALLAGAAATAAADEQTIRPEGPVLLYTDAAAEVVLFGKLYDSRAAWISPRSACASSPP